MMHYFIEETDNHEHHAGTKARQDVCDILASESWKPLKVRKRFGGNTLDKFKAIPDVFSDWSKVSKALSQSDVLLIQFPVNTYPKVAPFALPSLYRIKAKGVKIIMLIHDLETLRTGSDISEKKFLSLADAVIVHNKVMMRQLQRLYPNGKFIPLGIFDYLTNAPTCSPMNRNGIDIAGNLTPEKSPYVYTLATQYPDIHFNLYGPNFIKDSAEVKWYRGSFSPEQLPSILHGKFGLVWDGNSTTTCSGATGAYMRINNPHKLSLYLASREPVIIWDQAAEASFVKEHHLGIVAPSITNALQQINQMPPEEYQSIEKSVDKICKRLRSGYYLNQAITKAMALL